MANIKSAKKRILVQAKREARNKAYRTNLKSCSEKRLTQLSQKTQRTKMLWLKQLLKQLTRLVQKGIIHKNCAARKKSTLAALAK